LQHVEDALLSMERVAGWFNNQGVWMEAKWINFLFWDASLWAIISLWCQTF